MAFTAKRWNGSTSGDYSAAANWDAISVRNDNYTWTASGSGTNEYYLRTAANADPGFINKPDLVFIAGTQRVEGTAGSLTNLQWDYADNDTLGYSTLYIRLDAGDPDLQAPDYVTFKQLPKDADDVRIPAGSGAITSGLTAFASIGLNSWYRERGHVNLIGSSSGPLFVSVDGVIEHWGIGLAYINVSGDNPVKIYETASASEGNFGLYLTGSANNLAVMGGPVGVAVRHGDSFSLSNGLRVTNAGAVTLGVGCSVTGTIYQSAGLLVQRCNSTTTTIEGGTFRSEEVCTIGTLNLVADSRLRSATATLNSSGTITTLNLENASATVDRTQTGVSATITTCNHEAGTLIYDGNTTTITTYNKPTSGPARLSAVAG